MAKINWRRIRKWLLLFAVAGMVFFAGVVWFVGGALVASANRVVGPPPDDFPAATIHFSSNSGATIAAWHLPVPHSNATAILLHPIRSDRRSMLTRAKLLNKHGYSTLLIDLQAHGESNGEYITAGHLEKHDVLAAIDYVRNIDPGQKIAIVGSSLGGAAALFAQPDVDVIVLESVYPTVSAAVHNRVQMRLGLLHHFVAPLLLIQMHPRIGISPDQLCPIERMDEMRCPVLVASGDCDRHTTIEETRRLFFAANEPKKLVEFQGAEHVDLLAHDPEKYEKEVVAYINNIIGDRIVSVE